MKVRFLASKEYVNSDKNCGDCILILANSKLLVYDCGCEEHANRVIKIMDKLGLSKAVCVLSHNDADHFKGFEILIEKGRVDCIYTICALKHVDDIIYELDDLNFSRDEIKNKILEKFDNIKKLSGHLKDIYDSNNKILANEIFPGVKIVAPNYSYAIETIAKAINNKESDNKDGDSVMNAASVCLKVNGTNGVVLLTGDSSFANIESLLDGLDYIQLPHHGRDSQMQDIFEYYDERNIEMVYLISDNTGNSNGGCQDLRLLNGRNKKCTRQKEFEIDLGQNYSSRIGTFGDDIYEMLCSKK